MRTLAMRRLLWVVSMGAFLGLAFPNAICAADKPAALRSLDEVVAELPRTDVSGRVADKEGNPVKGAEVFLYYARGDDGLRDRLAGKTKTDAEGAYRFEKAMVWEPETGENRDSRPEYDVLAKHPNYGIEFAVLFPGDATENVSVWMAEPRKQRQIVTDTEGKPVEGVRVYLSSGQHSKELAKTVESGRQSFILRQDIGISSGVTDANGEVELLVPQQGEDFRFAKKGYVFSWGHEKIVLFPSARVSGRVAQPDGAPLAGAAVRFEYQGDNLAWSDATITDKKGRYEFPDVAAEGFRYSSMKPEEATGQAFQGSIKVEDLRSSSSLVSQTVSFPIQPKDDLTKDIQMTEACVLAGQVFDLTTGKPASKIRLSRYVQIGGSRYLDSVRLQTDSEGRFRTTVAPGSQVSFQWDESREGDYIIDQEWRQQPDNYQPFQQQVVNESRADLVFKVKLWQVQPFEGRVVNEKGEGAAKAQVHVHAEAGSVKARDDGSFSLKLAPTDRDFDLYAGTEDKTLAGLVHCKAGDTSATISLKPTADYEGVVTDSEGTPCPDLKFYMDLQLNGRPNYRVRVEPKTDAEGRFKAERLFPGATYYAFWSSDNEENRIYDYGNATVDLSALKPGEPIHFQAKMYTNTLIGRVVDAQGKPVAGALVAPSQASDLLPQDVRFNQPPIQTDAQGAFAIPRLAVGEIALRIQSPTGRKALQVTTPTDAVDFEAVLSPDDGPSHCQAKVVDANGKPMGDVPLLLRSMTYGTDGPSSSVMKTRTDAHGKAEFTLPALKEGAQGYTGYCAVIADAEGYALGFSGMPAGEDADLTMDLAKNVPGWKGRVVDDKGAPIAGAKVSVTNTSTQFVNVSLEGLADLVPALSVQTDADGRFELSRLRTDRWTNVSVSAAGYGRLRSYLDPRKGGISGSGQKALGPVVEKVFTLTRGGTVVGRIVLKTTGEPLRPHGRAMAYVQSKDPNASRGRGDVSYPDPAELAADGTFKAEGVPAGSWIVFVAMTDEKDQHWVCPAPPTVTVETGKTVEAKVEMEEGISLTGKLVDAKTGQFAPNSHVMAQIVGPAGAAAPGVHSAGAQVKKDGTWSMFLPREGKYTLQYYIQGVTKQGYAKHGEIEVRRDKPTQEVVIQVGQEITK